jgi:GT2 family glycosyltransferase
VTALPGNRWDLLDGVQPAEPPTVSVIVAHYDQPEQLARTLHALSRQDHPADRTEILVVDDGSPTTPVVPAHVRLLRQDDRGFRLAAARNLGAAAATGDVLVFLDADTAPEPSYLRELTRLPALAPDCLTVGRRRHAELSGTPIHDPVEQLGPAHELPEPAWLTDAYRRSRDLLDADDRSYRHVIGAVTACHRTLFDTAGGFDESFTSYGGEDWEWTYRAWLAGAVLAHVPTAVAWHDGPEWSDRDDGASLAAKNAETLLLTDLIPVPGSRGRGLPTAHADTVVVPPPGASAAERFVSLDSVLATLPGAVAGAEGRCARDGLTDRGPGVDRVPGGVDRVFDRVRIVVQLDRPLRVAGDVVREAVRRLDAEQLGELTLLDPEGSRLLRIRATRAEARERRWGRADLFPRADVVTDQVRALTEEPDLEAYLGGWG